MRQRHALTRLITASVLPAVLAVCLVSGIATSREGRLRASTDDAGTESAKTSPPAVDGTKTAGTMCDGIPLGGFPKSIPPRVIRSIVCGHAWHCLRSRGVAINGVGIGLLPQLGGRFLVEVFVAPGTLTRRLKRRLRACLPAKLPVVIVEEPPIRAAAAELPDLHPNASTLWETRDRSGSPRWRRG
jgi:hypothetical protein